MQFPKLQEATRYREMTTVFGGYNHQISCKEGQFFDMKNMTSKYFPVMSPRQNRGIVKNLVNPQGLLDKEDIWWIDDRKLYRNGFEVDIKGVVLSNESPKAMAKMGAYIIIMPDRIWVKTHTDNDKIECGYMENKISLSEFTISTCDAQGNVIEWHDAEYYKENTPKDGDYMMSINSDGRPSLKVYAGSTSIWMTVASTYTQISAENIGVGFEKEDGIKITGTFVDSEIINALKDILINHDEGDEYYTNTYVVDKTDNSITVPGIYKAVDASGSDSFPKVNENESEASSETEEDESDLSPEDILIIERKVPEMSYITECNNRLWGCSKDGHEIYCSKLGDVKNWNCFRGTATDSWAATIGSDGEFTAAITYLGYPIFFKEDSLVKISVSSYGGHQTKETVCRGVQKGSDRSLAILNETLYYKSTTGICGYNGGLPYSVSDELGDALYYGAAAGVIGDKYYVSMANDKDEFSLFVYDSKHKLWCREDGAAALMFCKHKDDLYYIDRNDNTMKSIGGTLPYDIPEKAIEDKFDWYVESGVIGYSSPDNKYVGRINLRITLELGTSVDFLIQYDSCGAWEHKFNMSGTGTRTYSIPIIPKRCDHFKYKITGKGDCKIHSITKTIEEGSDG